MKRCTGKDLFNCPKGHQNICDCARTECCLPDVKTNADHIRSLSDEELAWRMMQLNFCPPNIDEGKVCGDNANCHQCWVDWLKQPYKEDL